MASGHERVHFWQAPQLGGVELLHARYVEQRFAPHVHSGYVINVIEEGGQRFRHRGSDHLATVGSMILINPDEVHTGSKACETGWRYRACYPEVEQIGDVLNELDLARGGTPAFSISVLHDAEVARAFLRLHRSFDASGSALEQQTLWREALLLLFQRHARLPEASVAGRAPKAVALAKECLAEHLVDPPSLEELAAMVTLSPFHFARLFRRTTGLPPHAWLKQQRLERARELLKQGWPPAWVAGEAGFADQSHLSRQFKQAYGIGPGTYRKACARTFKTLPH
ncbi:AraC family transcriptional regulator [Billgrantia endophytica]|uniref:AraC family transcriptional regulator n=1 Tax=Billgrantia endophytica TaxID=2033802 RepID=A0A2N7U1S7_9GAMM|nr:AraC family transcriptional regulator [Halomonas endophytica]PMR74389.1 AraC family transcriptional regulator [Halomonas endophytica]